MSIVIRLFLVVSAVFFSGCTKSGGKSDAGVRRDVLNVAVPASIRTLNPIFGIATPTVHPIRALFDGLVYSDTSGDIRPALAESYEMSEGGRVYLFRLRDAVWSDGVKITAHDFEYTWKLQLDQTRPGEAFQFLKKLKNVEAFVRGELTLDDVGVKALDDDTLRVELEYPSLVFLQMVSLNVMAPVPKHKVEVEDDGYLNGRGDPSNFVTSGPYILKEWREEDFIKLEKNPLYWDRDEVRISEICMYFIADSSTAFSMYEKGDISWFGPPLYAMPSDLRGVVCTRDDFRYAPLYGLSFCCFDARVPPFSSTKFRQALSLSVDREDIANNLFGGGAVPAYCGVSPTFRKDAARSFIENRASAKALFDESLEELGLEREDLKDIVIRFRQEGGAPLLAQVLQKCWADTLDFEMPIELIQWNVLLSYLMSHENTNAITSVGYVLTMPDPSVFFDMFQASGKGYLNPSDWENAEYSALVASAEQEIDPDVRMGLFLKADEILMNEAAIIPITFYSLEYLSDPKLKGVRIPAMGWIDFSRAYFED